MHSSYLDYEWYLKNDFTPYAGKWIAILDQKVVAFGKNVAEVIEKVKNQYPSQKPLVTKVRNKLSIL